MTDGREIAESGARLPLTGKLPIFSYLTAERVDWYRAIMRLFLVRQRENYTYQLTAADVWGSIRADLDAAYTLDKCTGDLAALEAWGNLITTYDARRHTSIESFRSPAQVYQATPLAVQIEAFLADNLRETGVVGALRQGDLPRMWESLVRIGGWLDEAARTGMADDLAARIADEWRQVFSTFTTMQNEVAQYLGTLATSAREARPDLASFQTYKSAVVAYVLNFGQALTQYSSRFSEQMTAWRDQKHASLLVEAIAAHLDPPQLDEAKRRPRQILRRDVMRQTDAFAGWFAAGGSADVFRQRAREEVDKVVRRAASFADAARPSAAYAADLDALARRMLAATSEAEAVQLALVAFAHPIPAILPEGLVGSSDKQTGGWKAEAEVRLTLRPIRRSIGLERVVEAPIAGEAERQEVLAHRMAARAAERQRIAALFPADTLTLGDAPLAHAADLLLLLTIVRTCLRDTLTHAYHASDGSWIVLRNPTETRFGIVRAPGGSLIMPRFALYRQTTRPTIAPSDTAPTRSSEQREVVA